MFRMNKLSDYGLVLLTHFARQPQRPQLSAVELAEQAQLPLPTVGKVLKTLARQGLLVSHRGSRGGYGLARSADQITVTQIIGALEGPIAITECTDHDGRCDYEASCPTQSHLKRLNQIVMTALDGVTLEDLAAPKAAHFERRTATTDTLFPLPPAASPPIPLGSDSHAGLTGSYR